RSGAVAQHTAKAKMDSKNHRARLIGAHLSNIRTRILDGLWRGLWNRLVQLLEPALQRSRVVHSHPQQVLLRGAEPFELRILIGVHQAFLLKVRLAFGDRNAGDMADRLSEHGVEGLARPADLGKGRVNIWFQASVRLRSRTRIDRGEHLGDRVVAR